MTITYTDVITLLTTKLPLQNIYDETCPATDGYVWAVRKKPSSTILFYVEDLSTFAKMTKTVKTTTYGPQFYSEADPAVTPRKTGIAPNIIKETTRVGINGGINISEYEAALIVRSPEITIIGGMEKYFGTINSRLDNIETRANYHNDPIWDRSQPSKYPIGPDNNLINDDSWHDDYIRTGGTGL
jgi:hypothetical protein